MTEITVGEAIYQLTNFEGTYETPSLEAIELAIKTLEKQIPRKPKIANNIYKQKCYWCPSCSHYFMECYIEDWFNKLMLEAMSHANAYCPNCGQKIDWSKV